MSWQLSEAAKRLRAEINLLYPKRDKKSDGALGDAAHSARVSDHNPDKNGWVRAIDIDEDLTGKDGSDTPLANALAAQIVALGKKDRRLKYVIFEGQIWSATYGWKAKPYTGVNAHKHHIHVSFNPAGDTDGRPFGLHR